MFLKKKPWVRAVAIRNVMNKLRHNNAMVFNGDVLGGTDLNAILQTHEQKQADVTNASCAGCGSACLWLCSH